MRSNLYIFREFPGLFILLLPVLCPVSFVFTYCFKIVFKMPTFLNSFCDVLDRSGSLELALVSTRIESRIAPTCFRGLQVF